MSSLDDRPFPTAALLGAGLLVLTTVAGVGTIQVQKHFAHIPLTATADTATPLQSRALRFVDQQDGVSVYGGHVQVFDAVTGTQLPQLRERDGFVRAVLNSLAYQRTKLQVNAPPVFTLSRWPGNKDHHRRQDNRGHRSTWAISAPATRRCSCASLQRRRHDRPPRHRNSLHHRN